MLRILILLSILSGCATDLCVNKRKTVVCEKNDIGQVICYHPNVCRP